MERWPRGFDSPTYLGLLWRAGVDRRWAEGGGAGYGRRRSGARAGGEMAVVVRDEVGNGVGLLIAGVRRFGGDISSGGGGGAHRPRR
jgi:hypothetical protein